MMEECGTRYNPLGSAASGLVNGPCGARWTGDPEEQRDGVYRTGP